MYLLAFLKIFWNERFGYAEHAAEVHDKYRCCQNAKDVLASA